MGPRHLLAVSVLCAGLLGACRHVVVAQRSDAASRGVLNARGTGRTHGVVAYVWMTTPARMSLSAGDVLTVPDQPGWQRYLITQHVVAIDAGAPVVVRGLCLDADRRPWPRGVGATVHVRSLQTWAEGRVEHRVVARAVSGPAAGRARADKHYASPEVADADDVVAQWALWRVTHALTTSDLAATIEREAPELSAEERGALVEAVWSASSVLLEVAGRDVAEEEGIDWAALDLSLK